MYYCRTFVSVTSWLRLEARTLTRSRRRARSRSSVFYKPRAQHLLSVCIINSLSSIGTIYRRAEPESTGWNQQLEQQEPEAQVILSFLLRFTTETYHKRPKSQKTEAPWEKRVPGAGEHLSWSRSPSLFCTRPSAPWDCWVTCSSCTGWSGKKVLMNSGHV